jgi:hypothetical protein
LAEEPEKSSALSAVILMLVVVAVAAYCMLYGLQTLAWFEGKHWASRDPWLNDVPQPLPASWVPDGTLTSASAYDYKFVTPWGAPKITPNLNFVVMRFNSGQVIVFFDPQTLLDTLGRLRSSSPTEYQKFANVFMDHPIDSNCALYQAVYSASAELESPVMSGREALRANVLLLWKLSFGFDTAPGIYSFQWGPMRGFQFDEPSKGRPVALRVFDDRDRQFRFLFLAAGGSHAEISQDDIAAVVSSLQPVPVTER